MIVCTALIERDDHDYTAWNNGSPTPREIRQDELHLEQAVSKVVGAIPLLWLYIKYKFVPDSLRVYVKRNSIAPLSNYGREHERFPGPVIQAARGAVGTIEARIREQLHDPMGLYRRARGRIAQAKEGLGEAVKTM